MTPREFLSNNWNALRDALPRSIPKITLPKSVNLSPSSHVSTGDESGFGSQGASYQPSRRKQRQPFKFGQ